MDANQIQNTQEVIISRQALNRKELSGVIKKLSELSPWRSVWAILRQWLLIIACFIFAIQLNNFYAYLFAAFIIATRQHALGILMHEATHYRLFNHKILNEWVSDFFCAFPIGMTTNGYRVEHLTHHRFTNTDDDPYWRLFHEDPIWFWPKTKSEALWTFMGDLLFYNMPKNFKLIGRWSPFRNLIYPRKMPLISKGEVFRLSLFYLFVISFIWFFDLFVPVFFLYLLPAMTISVLFTRIRTIAEHLALPNGNELQDTRHVDGGFLENLVFAPLNINYHIDHHIFPSVPYYHLPKLHEELLKISDYQKQARFVPTYTSFRDGVFSELIDNNPNIKVVRANG